MRLSTLGAAVLLGSAVPAGAGAFPVLPPGRGAEAPEVTGRPLPAVFPEARESSLEEMAIYARREKRSFAWDALAGGARVLVLGESRTSPQAVKLELARAVPGLRRGGATHLVVAVGAEHQKAFDCYGRGECSDDGWRSAMAPLRRYSSHYEAMVEAAFAERMRVVAGGMPRSEQDRLLRSKSGGRLHLGTRSDPNAAAEDLLLYWKTHDETLVPARREYTGRLAEALLEGDPAAKLVVLGAPEDARADGLPGLLGAAAARGVRVGLPDPREEYPGGLVGRALRRAGLDRPVQRWMIPAPRERAGWDAFILLPD